MWRQRIRRLLILVAVVAAAIVGVSVLSPPTREIVPIGGPLRFFPRETPVPSVATPPIDCRLDPAGLPMPSRPDGRPANYLHTCGNQIFDSSGREVRIAGLNWFGMETGTYAPHGLWTRNWRAILDQIAALGYNTIRVPYSNEALEPGRQVNGINFALNPELQGLDGLEMLDRLVEGAGERGLRVILDRHRPTSAGQTSLWYAPEVSEERWIADWRMLAERYHGNDTVIGADLHNEPRAEATWGTGDQSTDWRLAAERAGNAVLEVNPYWLILVQGIERYQNDWFWWGGDLRGVRETPVRLSVPNRVVYSPHDYGPGIYEQGWFQDPRFPDNLPEEWDRRWGYIHNDGIAPVVLGEFGGQSVGNDRDGQWQKTLLEYLESRRLGAITWALNPNSGDTGGVLAEDWQTVREEKQEAYRQILAPPIGVGASGTFGRAPSRFKVLFRQGATEAESSNIGFGFRILNDGPERIDLSRFELRYWFSAGDLAGRDQLVSVDWAEFGAENVRAEFVPVQVGDQDHYLRLQFAPGAGAVEAYRPSGEVLLRLHRSDWSNYVQSNDYSFRGRAEPADQLLEWDRVTLYLDGNLVWGREPGA